MKAIPINCFRKIHDLNYCMDRVRYWNGNDCAEQVRFALFFNVYLDKLKAR